MVRCCSYFFVALLLLSWDILSLKVFYISKFSFLYFCLITSLGNAGAGSFVYSAFACFVHVFGIFDLLFVSGVGYE